MKDRICTDCNALPQNASRRREKLSQRLKATHYILGNDEWGPQSEYRYKYTPKKGVANYLKNDRSTFLKNSHFLVGTTPLDYKTSSMVQSASIPLKGTVATSLDKAALRQLSETHFKLDNEINDYSTSYTNEYSNKFKDSKYLNDNTSPENLRALGYKFRKENYTLGNEPVNYKTETASKYTIPILNKEDGSNLIKHDTKEQQKSHIEFGLDPNNWGSTNKAVYTPKQINDRYERNEILKKYNSSLNNNFRDDRNFVSESMDSFCRKPLIQSKIDREQLNNIRKSHFDFGKDNDLDLMHSVFTRDFSDPRLNSKYESCLNVPLNSYNLKKNNWEIGMDKNTNYDTTYTKTMTPKKYIQNPPAKNNNYKSSIVLNGGGGEDNYQSVYRNDFKERMDKTSKIKEIKDINKIMNYIKKSHFDFGDDSNKYVTTMNDSYKYDKNLNKMFENSKKYRDARNRLYLNQFSIGENNKVFDETTNRHDFIPYKSQPKETYDIIEKRKSSFSLGNEFQNEFKGETIYMSDYTQKPLPQDNELDYM